MDTIKPLFTATATAIGGHNRHTEASALSKQFGNSLPAPRYGIRPPVAA
jgi:hypothetical protein